MAERKGRKTEVFLPCRGTNFEKTSKNAHDSRPKSFHVKRRQRTVPCLLADHLKLAPGPTVPILPLGFA